MDTSRICDCRAPMAVRCLPMTDREGRDTLVVIAKMTWAVSARGQARISRPLAPVGFFDIPRSDGRFASLKRASDAVEEKPGTDVLLLGTAYPQAPEATEQAVSLRVETGKTTLQKTLTVYGPRVWQPSLLGMAPGPAGKMQPTPLIYENAYGGYDDDGEPAVEWRNPAGTGFAERRKNLAGRPAPVIEDKQKPIASMSPTPAGFGPVPPHWSPRRERSGTRDDRWRRERAPLRPLDFDVRHHCSAPPDQWVESPLLGDEAIEVLGATPEGAWRFRLPRFAPEFHVTLKGKESIWDTHLDTLLIDADAGSVELTWRARIPLPRKTDDLQKVVIYGAPALPESIVAELASRVYGAGEAVEDG